MTYVATLALPGLNWTIRIDVATTLVGSNARYRRTDRAGDEEQYWCPIGPDTHGIGLPAIAIIDLIRDLNWANIDGSIYVIHEGAITQDDLLDILAQVRPAYAIRDLAAASVGVH